MSGGMAAVQCHCGRQWAAQSGSGSKKKKKVKINQRFGSMSGGEVAAWVVARWQHEWWRGSNIIVGVVQNGSGSKIKEKRGNNQPEVWLHEWWHGSMQRGSMQHWCLSFLFLLCKGFFFSISRANFSSPDVNAPFWGVFWCSNKAQPQNATSWFFLCFLGANVRFLYPEVPSAHCQFLLVGCYCFLGCWVGIFYHQTCWISWSWYPGGFLYFSFAIQCQGRASVCHPDALQDGSFLCPFFWFFARLPPIFSFSFVLYFFFFSMGGSQCLPPVSLLGCQCPLPLPQCFLPVCSDFCDFFYFCQEKMFWWLFFVGSKVDWFQAAVNPSQLPTGGVFGIFNSQPVCPSARFFIPLPIWYFLNATTCANEYWHIFF